MQAFDVEKTNNRIETIIGLIRTGYSFEEIKKKVSYENLDELFSIARARIQNARTGKLPPEFFFNEDDLRFATNQVVADYRAKRLSCKTIIDVGCGIGMQSIAFAKTCSRVIAVDIDERKIGYARINAKIAGAGNIEFRAGDGIEFAWKVGKADIVFCDPERPAAEDARTVESFRPNPTQLVDNYINVAENFCIEFPPQIRKIDFDCEKEFVSVEHELNRLNIYIGGLKKADVSAAILPSCDAISGRDEENIFAYASPLKFLYEIDGAVEKAGLASRISGNGLFFYGKHLTSEQQVRSPFFKSGYRILKTLPDSKPEIKEELQKLDAAKIVLHGSIDPQKYWDERKFFEKDLAGSRTLHLFLAGEEAILCEKI